MPNANIKITREGATGSMFSHNAYRAHIGYERPLLRHDLI
jgi:hypothetical protein